MKTTSAIRKSSRNLWVTMLFGGMTFVLSMGHAVLAQDHQLVMTENSPLSLTVTYDGSNAGINVSSAGTDLWLVTFPSTTHLGFELDWQEPGDPTLVNDFNLYNPDIGISNTWIVSSEFTLPGGAAQDSTQPGDGHTYVFFPGSDSLDNLHIDVTFSDLESAPAVPEPATWLAGLLSAGAVLFGFRRSSLTRRR